MRILIDHRNKEYYLSESRLTLVAQVPKISFDQKTRTLTIRGAEDTVSFSPELKGMDLEVSIADRAIYILERDYGFKLYSTDSRVG